MKKNTVLMWAKSIDISEAEYNECLVEMGYQVHNTKKNKWELTLKGKGCAKIIFRRIYWDIDAHFEVMKLIGKKTHMFFYCEKCNVYNKIPEEYRNNTKIVCARCGSKAFID